MKAMSNAQALVVGIAKYYLVNPLPATVVKDAMDMHAVLVDPDLCGYPKKNAQLLHDRKATLDNLRKALKLLATRCTADSTVFIYISGLGGRIETGPHAGEYIIPVDGDAADDPTLAAGTGIGSLISTRYARFALHPLPKHRGCGVSGRTG